MKKLLTILSLVLFVICGVNVYSATKTTKKSSKGVRASSNKTSSARESRGRSGSAKSVRTGSSRSLRASAVSSASSDASTTDATATESKQTREFAKYMAGADVHSEDKLRVNRVIVNCDEFYKAFGITEKDGMWVAPSDRVKIW